MRAAAVVLVLCACTPGAHRGAPHITAVNRAGRAFEMSDRVREALQVADHVARTRRGPGPRAGDFTLFWQEARDVNPYNSSRSLHIRFAPSIDGRPIM